MPIRKAKYSSPIQGFAPDEIRTAVTELDLQGVMAIRIGVEAEYSLNGITANKAWMPPGVTVIAHGVTAVTFTSAQVVEVMLDA